MQRRVWSCDELAAILRAVAMLGGDPRTLAAIAVAIGLPPTQEISASAKPPTAESTYTPPKRGQLDAYAI